MSIKKYQQERQFSFALILVFIVIGLWPLINDEAIKTHWLAISAIQLMVAWVVPGVLSPIVRIWVKIGHMLGVINSHILLAIAFYFVITPVALLFKLMGRDGLALRWHNKKKSYWHRHEKTWSPDSFKKQF